MVGALDGRTGREDSGVANEVLPTTGLAAATGVTGAKAYIVGSEWGVAEGREERGERKTECGEEGGEGCGGGIG